MVTNRDLAGLANTIERGEEGAHDALLTMTAEIVRLRVGLDSYREEVERLRGDNAKLREIVDALAYEDRYQAATGEGSINYLARLISRAQEYLEEHPA